MSPIARAMKPSRAVPIALLAFACAASSVAAQDVRDQPQSRKYHLGITTIDMRHLNVVGLGLIGAYGDWDHSTSFVNWGGEILLLHSGEQRVPRLSAWNKAYSDTTYSVFSDVYEQVSSIGIGGSLYRVLRTPPPQLDWVLPGVTIGLSAGAMFEMDRVGLQSSDLQAYYGYGYGGPSDTNVTLRPYVRPQVMLGQGPIDLTFGMAFFPEFASWSIGLAYGW